MIISSKSVLEISCKNQEIAFQVQNLIFWGIDIVIFNTWKNNISIHNNVLQFEVIETEEEDYFDFINTFLHILDGKYNEMESIWITRKDITFWHYGKYVNQCNFELSPERMKKLGENDIDLCLSFMDISWNEYIEIGWKNIKKSDWF